MNIGLVSTWLHRGAAYVTINYAKLLKHNNNIFVYGRGGEYFDKNLKIDGINVYEGCRTSYKDGIVISDFLNWIKKNNIEIVFWNEQRDLTAMCKTKLKFPHIIHGAYIDYYTEDSISDFQLYDFVICNTKRHYSVFEWHKQAFYLPWGCDIDLYKQNRNKRNTSDKITFFHSMGMSNRKGTEVLIKTFISNKFKELGAKLIIHTQINIDNIITKSEALNNNIEIIEKTVSAPGLYYMGDVYVYPAKLDGLGLTLYEAISSGLPVITTDIAPMNEVINEQDGKLVKVKKLYSRSDGYYWPLAEVDEDSLRDALMYYVTNADKISTLSDNARKEALNKWNWNNRKEELLRIFNNVKKLNTNEYCETYLKNKVRERRIKKRNAFIELFVPKKIFSLIKKQQVKRKYNLN